MNTNRHVWEGWTVQDFIDELELQFDRQRIMTNEELKRWCMDNQPYYKKHIPEVFNHFKSKTICQTGATIGS